MNPSAVLRILCLSGCALLTLLLFNSYPVDAADGKKWDGKRYPFRLLNPSQPNGESNPFIIDTAGKLAYFAWLAKSDLDMADYGKKNGLNGLNQAFSKNFVKLAADLDMNGSKFEFVPIPATYVSFDGGGHVIYNLRISDKTTKAITDDVTGEVEMHLALFQGVGMIKNLGIGKGSTITNYGLRKEYPKRAYKVYAAGITVSAWGIDNCFSDATIAVKEDGEAWIGGIAANCESIANSYNRGAITFEGTVINSKEKNKTGKILPGPLWVAGVCAIPAKKMSGCYNTGAITVRASGRDLKIGGVAAETNDTDCMDLNNTGALRVIATGAIKKAHIGGVLGYGSTSRRIYVKPIKYVDRGIFYNKGAIAVTVHTGDSINAGGIIGGDKGGFGASSYAFGGVYGCINAYNTGSISVTSTGTVGALSAGGIAGNLCMVINSYNSGRISGASGAGTTLYLGGLGGSDVYVQNGYNIGAVSAKGSGTNFTGGVIGHAGEAIWGEVDTALHASLNGFWLKQSKSGGINSDIKYAKGSYFYKKKSEIKKANSGIGTLIDSFDKEDPNTMIEASYGAVYSFDGPSASVMTRSDDAKGKRSNLNGTLLDNLNRMVEDRINRLYRRWVVDGTNGGYPVLSPKPTVFSHTSEKPDASVAQRIAGEYWGVHKQWNDRVFLGADGSFRRAKGGDGGAWSFTGKRIILRWAKWEPEILEQKSAGAFSSNVYNFTLKRTGVASPDASVPTDKPVSPLAKKLAGVYYAQHKDWTSSLTINANGSFTRDSNGDRGTWTYDGKTLVLTWDKGASDTLKKTDTGFYCPAYKFTLRQR